MPQQNKLMLSSNACQEEITEYQLAPKPLTFNWLRDMNSIQLLLSCLPSVTYSLQLVYLGG